MAEQEARLQEAPCQRPGLFGSMGRWNWPFPSLVEGQLSRPRVDELEITYWIGY